MNGRRAVRDADRVPDPDVVRERLLDGEVGRLGAGAKADRVRAGHEQELTRQAQPDRRDVRVYMGTIVKDGDAYILKSGNEKYLLDSQKKAKNYKGKDVEVTGTLDKEKHLIHVEKIKVSPAM